MPCPRPRTGIPLPEIPMTRRQRRQLGKFTLGLTPPQAKGNLFVQTLHALEGLRRHKPLILLLSPPWRGRVEESGTEGLQVNTGDKTRDCPDRQYWLRPALLSSRHITITASRPPDIALQVLNQKVAIQSACLVVHFCPQISTNGYSPPAGPGHRGLQPAPHPHGPEEGL